MKLNIKGKADYIHVKIVFFIPKFGFKLISLSVLNKFRFVTQFGYNRVMFSKQGNIAATGTLSSTNLYVLGFYKCPVPAEKALTSSLQLWHHSFAHVDPAGIKQRVSSNVLKIVQITAGLFDIKNSLSCILGKRQRTPFICSSDSKTCRPLQLVHADVVGLLDTPCIGGSRYFITLIVDLSKWTVMFTMRNKSESLDYFKYHNFPETHIDQKVNKVKISSYCIVSSLCIDIHDVFKVYTLRSDSCHEYISNAFSSYMNDLGI